MERRERGRIHRVQNVVEKFHLSVWEEVYGYSVYVVETVRDNNRLDVFPGNIIVFVHLFFFEKLKRNVDEMLEIF